MTSAQTDLITRLRALLADEPEVREASMFGGRSFMVGGRMVVAARKGGGLLVRIPPERRAELLARPGASGATMGADRDMGPGWIEVAPSALGAQDELAYWLGVALEHRRNK